MFFVGISIVGNARSQDAYKQMKSDRELKNLFSGNFMPNSY